MSDYFIKGTMETPEIELNSEEGILIIKGRSIPENSIEFYEPFIEALGKYVNNPSDQTKVDFRLEYFNTSSSKCILDILQLLQKLYVENGNVTIDWCYDEDDEEIEEIGQDYSHMINVPFNIKVIAN
ncbi:MAG: DUF1987 domain-containing protein [Flavobacteriales bacterium]|nr:DUF1987 domain-containing protein [Flavobacteriales bacterium]